MLRDRNHNVIRRLLGIAVTSLYSFKRNIASKNRLKAILEEKCEALASDMTAAQVCWQGLLT